MEEPAGKGCLTEDLEDPGVVDGVESLSRVKQEDEPLDVLNDALVEEPVEVFDVGVTIDTGEETLLSRVKEGGDGGHNGPSDSAGQQAIVGVGDTDGTGIGRDRYPLGAGKGSRE